MTVASVQGKVRLVMVSLGTNNAKWWEGEVVGSEMHVTFGRLGESGQSVITAFGSEDKAHKAFATKLREKERHGYTVARTEGNIDPSAGYHRTNGSGYSKTAAAEAARRDIAKDADPETVKLVDFLAQRNIHTIEGATAIRVQNGVLETPLGRVTADAVTEAAELLDRIGQEFTGAAPSSSLSSLVDSYLRIIPRPVKRARGGIEPTKIFPDADAVRAELELLEAVTQAVTGDVTPETVFRTQLVLCTDGGYRFTKAKRLFESALNANHGAAARMKLVRVWETHIGPADEAWEAEGKAVGNVTRLWHGSTDSNLLSLLKSGYIIPKSSGSIRITGRMFGDGVYFSKQSSKSLRYATGAWGGGASQRTFMLLNDVATGKRYAPRTSFAGRPPKGYDSTWVEAGAAGVMNHECVVYRAAQARPRYICEFK